MLKIREAIVVEGRYDKNTLSQLVDTVILETSGFGIFKDRETLALLRKIGAKRGLILLTDSDGAGFVIRNYLKGTLPPEQVKHAYIPDCFGKEKRKRRPGKEGKLGVEGMSPTVLETALRRAAFEEAEHAAKFAELLGEVVTDSTKKNLEMRVDAENGATAGKFELAKKAKELGLDAIHDTVHEMARDEARHGKAFEGLLKRYFG